MVGITTLLENAVIADLLLDAFIGQFPVRPHDFTLAKGGDDDVGEEEDTVVVVVTAYDYGDFDRTFGAGIRNVHLEVQINVNVLAPDYANTLDELDGLISGRLQPSSSLPNVFGREDAFGTFQLKVFGILDSGVKDERIDVDLMRQRIVERTFVCAQIA